MRTDDPVFADQHCKAINEIGIREFLAVGPRRPPFPRKYRRFIGDTSKDVMISFDEYMNTAETIIRRWNKKCDGRINICVTFPTTRQNEECLSIDQTQRVRELSRRYDVLFMQDGHRRGTVKVAHEKLGILGSDALLSHATDLTSEEIDICSKTNTRIVHNPSARASIKGRCPVPELLDAGVTVMLGSDASAPDRGYDMFRHMFQCMHYHRTYYHDDSYIPPGKVLEMTTIDSARGLGLEKELGSLEPGKKADVVLVDVFKPHTYPFNMPVQRLTYFAHGSDVDTVIVNGKILMEKRIVKSVDEVKVLEMAQHEAEAALDRTQLTRLLEPPDRFWRHSKY